MARWLHRVMSAGRRETGLLLALVVLAGGSWAYIEIAESVHGNKTRQIDESILLALREPGRPDDPLGPIWAEQLARDLTALGSLGVLSLLTILSSCFLVLKRKNRTAVLLLTAVATGMLMSVALKMGADRPRPNLVPHLTWAMSTSFPSGHAMTSAVTYLTLGSLLARAAAQRREKAFFLGAAVLISWIVGFSRVYLGVHWPTDVLAGWTAGAIWAFLWWLIARRLQQRGEVERESPL
jgi:undecaprenyl-diphosphatase